MAVIAAERQIEVQAPISVCWGIITDLAETPRWQDSMATAEVLQTDASGHGTLARVTFDARVREIAATIEISYEPERSMTWEQEDGDLKWLTGGWSLEALGDELTRAVYSLKADTGRVLGLLIKGPVEDRVKETLTSDATEGLKARAEGS